MPKVRTSVVSARAEVEQAPRDRATPAPAESQPIPLSAHGNRNRSLASSTPNALPSSANVVANSNSNSNTRSTPRARIPLGAREDSFPPLSSDLPRKRGHSSLSLAARAEASTAKTAAKPPALSFPRAPAVAGNVAHAGRPQRSYRDVVAPVADSTQALMSSVAGGHLPASIPGAAPPFVSLSLGVSGPAIESARIGDPLRPANVPIDSPIAPRRLLPDGSAPSNSSRGPGADSFVAPTPRVDDFSAITEPLFSPIPFPLDSTATHGRPAIASEPSSTLHVARAAEEIEYVTEDENPPTGHQEAVHFLAELGRPASSLLPSGNGPSPAHSDAPPPLIPGARQLNEPRRSAALPMPRLGVQPQASPLVLPSPLAAPPQPQQHGRPGLPESQQQQPPYVQLQQSLRPATPSMQQHDQVVVPPAPQSPSLHPAPAPAQHSLQAQTQPSSRPATPSSQQQQATAPSEQLQSSNQHSAAALTPNTQASQIVDRQVRLSHAAGQQLIELHQTENGLLPPLEAQSCAGLLDELKELAAAKFGVAP